VGQFTSASKGTVFDPTGLVTPGATVTLANLDTGVSQTTTTTGAVTTASPLCRPDATRVKVELQGFRTTLRRTFASPTAEIATVNVKLEVATPRRTSRSPASAPLVETAEVVSGLITGAQVRTCLCRAKLLQPVVLTPG